MRNIADRLTKVLDQDLTEALAAAKSGDFARTHELMTLALQQLKIISNELGSRSKSSPGQNLGTGSLLN